MTLVAITPGVVTCRCPNSTEGGAHVPSCSVLTLAARVLVVLVLDDAEGPGLVEMLDAANNLVDELITKPKGRGECVAAPALDGAWPTVRPATRMPTIWGMWRGCQGPSAACSLGNMHPIAFEASAPLPAAAVNPDVAPRSPGGGAA